MRRVLVVGMSGAGKTTAARRVGARLGLPFHEMDALALGPNWSQPPNLVDEVRRITAAPAWIFDSWGYPAVRDLMWQSADTLLWLDYPATVVLPRLIRRSAVRTATNAELFGGNRDTLRERGRRILRATTLLQVCAGPGAVNGKEESRIARYNSPSLKCLWSNIH